MTPADLNSVIAALKGMIGSADGPAYLAMAIGLLAVTGLLRFFRRLRRAKKDWVIIDGSNVMHWKDGEPQLDPLREVIAMLKHKGATPALVFDANAGYLVSNKYQHLDYFARTFGLPEADVIVVPKGSPADTIILQAAREYGARIVTNDRFRDWADDFPEVQNDGLLIRGGYRAKKLWLDL